MNFLRRFTGAQSPGPSIFAKATAAKADDGQIVAWSLSSDGRVNAIKQGSGVYGSGIGYGSDAFSETAFGTQIALSQSTFGWSAAYSVSTWVYRCIEVRKNAVHRMPWAVYSKRSGSKLPRHPLAVNLRQSRQHLFKKIEQSQLLFGETFIELAYNTYNFSAFGGTPQTRVNSSLYWLNNNGMAVLVGAGMIVGYAYTAMQGGSPQNFEPDEVAFMKTDNPFNDLRGMSPTEVVMDDIAIDKDVARVVRAYYANDTRTGILLIPKVTLSPGDDELFMATWNKQNQGVNKAGKANLMPYDMSVERVQEPATLDDVQLRESVRRAIAAAYGVPLSLAGGWDDAKYQSLPEQRKSFYEETILPECDNIADFMNTQVMPYYDDSGNAEFRYDYISILALTEDAQKKNDIYSNRLVSGLITRAEARAALGHPVRDVDDVYYIPTGATVVPANQEALVTPHAVGVDDTSQEQTGGAAPSQGPTPTDTPPVQKPPAPDAPLPTPQPPQPSAPGKSIAPPQDDAGSELSAWERKATNSNSTKALGFTCYVTPPDIQDAVRAGLSALGPKNTDKLLIRAVFAGARAELSARADNSDDIKKKNSLKSYEDTAGQFARTVRNAIMAGVNDLASRGAFDGIMSGALRTYGTLAYQDGLQVGGDIEELDDFDRGVIDDWYNGQIGYVAPFATEVFADGIAPDSIDGRAAAWANKSLRDIYSQGLAQSAKHQRFKWVLGPNEQHCPDCQRLSNQVHRYAEWYARDWLPGSNHLACKSDAPLKGYRCQCQLVPTDEPSQGNF